MTIADLDSNQTSDVIEKFLSDTQIAAYKKDAQVIYAGLARGDHKCGGRLKHGVEVRAVVEDLYACLAKSGMVITDLDPSKTPTEITALLSDIQKSYFRKDACAQYTAFLKAENQFGSPLRTGLEACQELRSMHKNLKEAGMQVADLHSGKTEKGVLRAIRKVIAKHTQWQRHEDLKAIMTGASLSSALLPKGGYVFPGGYASIKICSSR